MSKSASELPSSDSRESAETGTVIAFPAAPAGPAQSAAAPADPAGGAPPPETPKKRRAPSKPRGPRGPKKGRTTKNQAPPLGDGVRHRFEGFWGWIEGAGLHVAGVQSFLFFWKRLGLKGLLAVLLVGGYPLGQYSVLSYVANSTVPQLAGDFGVTFEAKDWSYHPFSLKTVARHVQIRAKHDPRAQPIFTAGEVEFQGSLASTFAGLKHLLIEWRGFHTFNAVTIKHGTIHLERSATGHLNWSDYAESIPAKRRDEFLAGLYQINTVVVDDVRVNYVEHVQGNSGGGIIQTVQANLYVDGIHGTISEITQARDGNSLPTKVRFTGRLADGVVEMNGRVGFVNTPSPAAPAIGPQSSAPSYRSASTRQPADGIQGGPYYDVVLALNNIGAAAFARAMPPTRIMATSGTLSGKMELRHTSPVCVAEAAMHDVRFAPNPQLVPMRAEYERLQELLKNRVVSKPYKACDPLSPESTRPAASPKPETVPPYDPTQRARSNGAAGFIASFNEQANEDAPPEVRSVVARDSQGLTGTVMTASYSEAMIVPTSVEDVVSTATDQIHKRVNNTLAKKLGINVVQTKNSRTSLDSKAPPNQDENAVTKGVKGIGRGIKKLFGGGDKNDDKKKDEKKKPGT